MGDGTIRTEIAAALTTLHAPPGDFRELPDSEAAKVRARIEAVFMNAHDPKWWWEHFRLPTASVRFEDQKAFRRICDVVPDPDEAVWFVAEDDQLPYFPVFEATPSLIMAVIGECYGFEYYLIAKDYSWLLCENHHDYLIGMGETVRSRLEAVGEVGPPGVRDDEVLPFRAHRRELDEPYGDLCDLIAETAVARGSAGQDVAAVGGLDGALVMVVADGAGGSAGGTEAAVAVLDAASGSRLAGETNWTEVLRAVDESLADRGQTTAVIVQILGDKISGASVGDSAAWLFTPATSVELTERQRRKPLVGSGHCTPVPFTANFAAGSVLVLGSDGLFKYAKRQAIEQLARSGAPASAFVDLVRLPTGGLQDDVAVVVCREAEAV